MEVAKLLVENGANIETHSNDSILYKICSRYDTAHDKAEQLKIIKFLLDKGCNPDEMDYENETPDNYVYSDGKVRILFDIARRRFSKTGQRIMTPPQ